MVRPALIRGAALVTAMLIAALAATIVATLAAGQSQWLRTVELRRDQVQAEAIVMAGLAWTRQVLQDDARTGDLDHLGEPWALPLPPTPLEGGLVEGTIVDAQGRLDLNDLGGTGPGPAIARERLARLFGLTGLGNPAYEAVIAAASPTGEPRWMRAAEVSSLPGLGEARFARVAPFVTALPARASVNVNTASPEVLAAVVEGLSGDALAALVAERTRKPFGSIGDLRSRLPAGARLASEERLAVRSEFFLATVRARQGEALAQGRALLRRRGRDAPEVVWQTIE
jgi:general secretion pathway protein K